MGLDGYTWRPFQSPSPFDDWFSSPSYFLRRRPLVTVTVLVLRLNFLFCTILANRSFGKDSVAPRQGDGIKKKEQEEKRREGESNYISIQWKRRIFPPSLIGFQRMRIWGFDRFPFHFHHARFLESGDLLFMTTKGDYNQHGSFQKEWLGRNRRRIFLVGLFLPIGFLVTVEQQVARWVRFGFLLLFFFFLIFYSFF